jgi:hypothetical protein
MNDKVIRYVSYGMAFLIGMIANRISFVLGFYIDSKFLSVVAGWSIGMVVYVIWKVLCVKFFIRKQEDKLKEFK